MGYGTHFFSGSFVFFPALRYSLGSMMLTASQGSVQAASPCSADIRGKDHPELSRSTAGTAGAVMSHAVCMPLALRQALLVFAVSLSTLVGFHPLL